MKIRFRVGEDVLVVISAGEMGGRHLCGMDTTVSFTYHWDFEMGLTSQVELPALRKKHCRYGDYFKCGV